MKNSSELNLHSTDVSAEASDCSLWVNSIQCKTNGVAGRTRQSRISQCRVFPEQGSVASGADIDRSCLLSKLLYLLMPIVNCESFWCNDHTYTGERHLNLDLFICNHHRHIITIICLYAYGNHRHNLVLNVPMSWDKTIHRVNNWGDNSSKLLGMLRLVFTMLTHLQRAAKFFCQLQPLSGLFWKCCSISLKLFCLTVNFSLISIGNCNTTKWNTSRYM